ncbi:MAG: cytidine deaminase [Waddliaceae bacterium]
MEELLNPARQIIRERFKEDYHHVGAALRTKSGKIFSAVNLEAYVGRIAICAEAIALGMAAADGDTDIRMILAVNQDGDVVSPCGMCRELIYDYSPHAQVVVPDNNEVKVVSIAELLPNKYVR